MCRRRPAEEPPGRACYSVKPKLSCAIYTVALLLVGGSIGRVTRVKYRAIVL